MKTWTIAVAGLGAAARGIHLPAYRKVPHLKVVAGADPAVGGDAQRLGAPHGHRGRGASFGFPLFTGVEEMLRSARPDILAVVTPPEQHFEPTRLGLLAGCHVFCEKPFMTSLEEADAVIALAARAGRAVVVNNQYRFMNIHRVARERIGSPEFGGLLFLDARQSFYTTEETERGWRGRDVRRTCKEFGTHVFDLCRFFFGEDPRSISARMPRPERPEGPDLLNLLWLEFSGDRVAQITLDRLCRGPHDYLTTRLDGSAGYLETHLGGGFELCVGIRGGTRRPFAKLDLSLGGRARLFRGERSRKIASDPLDVFAHATGRLMRAFLEALERGEAPPCDAVDNRKTLALMLKAYESAERGRPVLLEDPAPGR